MLTSIKNLIARLMMVPPEPHDPMGEVGSLRVFRAAKNYLYYRYLIWLGRELVMLLIIVFFFGGFYMDMRRQDPTTANIFAIFVGTVFVVQFFISIFMVWLEYEMRWYKISDRSLRIRYGVWNVREHTVTFANIQNMTVTQGPVQRLLGIGDLKVDTAGGGGSQSSSSGGGMHGGLIGILVQSQVKEAMFNMHQAVFRGVDNAEEIRDLMVVRLRRVRDSGLGETVETSEVAGMTTGIGPVATAASSWSAGAVDLLAALRQEAAALRAAAEGLKR